MHISIFVFAGLSVLARRRYWPVLPFNPVLFPLRRFEGLLFNRLAPASQSRSVG